MEIGIFTKVFVRSTLEETLDAVRDHGIHHVQFNMTCVGEPAMPEQITLDLCDRIRQKMAARGLTMAAVSGTFNMIHPDRERRREGLRRLHELARACERLGTNVVTLCTGTRDPDDMWRRHPENDSPEAWKDLIESMQKAAKIAEETGVTFVIEPEVSNVVDSARKARRLLDDLQSPRVKVVIDGANLFHTGELPRMHEILDEAFALLGKDIIMAHAKDLSRDGEAGHEAAGTGLLDYDHYIVLLHATGYKGPLILHSLDEAQVEGCVAFLRSKIV